MSGCVEICKMAEREGEREGRRNRARGEPLYIVHWPFVLHRPRGRDNVTVAGYDVDDGVPRPEEHNLFLMFRGSVPESRFQIFLSPPSVPRRPDPAFELSAQRPPNATASSAWFIDAKEVRTAGVAEACECEEDGGRHRHADRAWPLDTLGSAQGALAARYAYWSPPPWSFMDGLTLGGVGEKRPGRERGSRDQYSFAIV